MALIARSHYPNICQSRAEKSRKLQCQRICEFPLLSSLFSESHLAARGDNHPNTVTRDHGKRELKRKGRWHSCRKFKFLTLFGKLGQRPGRPDPSLRARAHLEFAFSLDLISFDVCRYLPLLGVSSTIENS